MHELLFAIGGMALASIFWVAPHWLNVRDEGYALGYGAGFKDGVRTERSVAATRSKRAPDPLHPPRHSVDSGDHRHE